jgi:hypothetical protein
VVSRVAGSTARVAVGVVLVRVAFWVALEAEVGEAHVDPYAAFSFVGLLGDVVGNDVPAALCVAVIVQSATQHLLVAGGVVGEDTVLRGGCLQPSHLLGRQLQRILNLLDHHVLVPPVQVGLLHFVDGGLDLFLGLTHLFLLLSLRCQ